MNDQQELGLVLPDAEVTVRVSGSDVAVIAFFQNGKDTLDCLIGVDDTTKVDAVLAMLDDASTALHGARWVTLSDVAEASSGSGDDPGGEAPQETLPF